MKNFKVLIFLDKFRSLFEKAGIDYSVMRKILQVKLVMDNRRELTVFTNNNKKKDTEANTNFFRSLLIYFFMGIILIPFVILKQNYIYQMGIVFGIIMFFIMTSLISDFSSVLLDIKDSNIIGTRPVDKKTLRLAKTIHVTIYIFLITAALVGPSLLISLFCQGILFFLIYLIFTLLMDFFCIVLTSFVYILVLRFFDGEKLKDIINYIQIILSIVIMVGYQLLSRLFSIVDFKVSFVPKWWQYFIAPIWFSAPFQIIKKSEINSTFIIFTVMAIAVPVAAILIYINIMPHFERYLQKLSNNSEKCKRGKRRPLHLISKIVCRDKEERIFFRFAADMMKNEREFKLKVYPSLGFSLVFPFIFIFQQLSDSGLKEISKGHTYFFIYFCGLMLPTIILMIKYSATYKGAWIYKALPIKKVAPIFRGTIKAFIVKLFLPLYLLVAVIFIAIYGFRIFPDLLIVFLNMMIFNIISFMAFSKALPFSEPFGVTKSENAVISFLLFFLLAGLAGIHIMCTFFPITIYIYMVVAVIVNLLLWKNAFNISADKLNVN